jgi:AraC-like DNA-binding protein
MEVPLIRSNVIVPIGTFLAGMGAPVERFFQRAGLPPWVLTDLEALIPTASVGRLLAHAARVEGIPNLGALAARNGRIDSLGTYGRLVRASRTLGDALATAVHFHATFTSGSDVWLASRGKDVKLCQAFTARTDSAGEAWRQVSQYGAMFMLRVVRLAAGPTWQPRCVELQIAECAALRDTEPLSFADVRFGQPMTAITFPRALLDELLPPFTGDVPVSHSVQEWEASAPARDLVESVVQVVETLSWEGYPDIQMTADFIGISVRTLQRHLAAAGVTHEALVGRARFATAVALLEETDSKILDIALDLGYSDHAHFTRAFRRWAGCSPQQFRRQRRMPVTAAAGTQRTSAVSS